MAEGVITIESDSEDDVIVISDEETDFKEKKSSSPPPLTQSCLPIKENLSPNSKLLLLEQERRELEMVLEISRREYEAIHRLREGSPEPSTSKQNVNKNSRKINLEKTWCKIKKERERDREKNRTKNSTCETPSKKPRLEVSDSVEESEGEFSDGLPDLDDKDNVHWNQGSNEDDVTIEVKVIEDWSEQEDDYKKSSELIDQYNRKNNDIIRNNVSTENNDVIRNNVSTKNNDVIRNNVSTENNGVIRNNVSTKNNDVIRNNVSTKNNDVIRDNVSTKNNDIIRNNVSTKNNDVIRNNVSTENNDVIRDNASTSPKPKEIIFDDKTKNKLASIIKNTKLTIDKKFRNGVQGDGDRNVFSSLSLPRSNSSENMKQNEDSSSERHFMDFFLPNNCEKPKTNFTSQQTFHRILNSTENKSKSIFTTTSPLKLQKRKNVPRKTSQNPDTLSDLPKSMDFMPSDLKQTRNAKKLTFPEREIETLSSSFSQMHINAVLVNFEEEGNTFLSQGLEFLNNFSSKYAPPEKIVQEVLQSCIIKASSPDLIFKAYKTLLFVLGRYPNVLHISWDNIKDAVDDIGIGRGIPHQDPVILMKTSLLLDLAVICFEDDLYNRNIADHRYIRGSFAYSVLSYDCSFHTNVRQIINWIVCLLTSGEYIEIDETYLGRIERQQHNYLGAIELNEVSKILPKLQKLLDISINVSSSCCDAAKAISSELLKSFIYLPNISHKMLLLHTMQSDLLKFKLVSLVLENYCEATLPGLEFPDRLNSLVECYFRAMPPRNILTPPTTPQSEDEEEDNLAGCIQHSPSAVEELSVLLYYIVCSYLNCVKNKSHTALRRRAGYTKHKLSSLPEQDVQDLEDFPRHVEKLREHLLSIADITPKTQEYLMKMLCLSNMKSYT